MAQMMRRVSLVLFLVIGAAVLIPALTAFGHADYESSTPAKDEVVAIAPTEVEAVFTQEIRRIEGAYYLRVEDASGAQVSEGDGAINDDDRAIMTATFPSALTNGSYIVRWKTTSDADGDEDEGAFCFHVVDQPSVEQSAACAALDEEEDTTPAATGGETPATTSEATPAATSADTSEPAGSPTAPNGTDDDDDDDSNTGIIIGIIVTVVAVIAVGGGIAVYMRQRQ